MWMKVAHLDAYAPHFKSAGIRRGVDLQDINETVLRDRVGVQDEFHCQIILECLNELEGHSNTAVSEAVCGERLDYAESAIKNVVSIVLNQQIAYGGTSL